MQSFKELITYFSTQFKVNHFPNHTPSLYEPNNYFLSLGGKHIRPVALLMANELFGDIKQDALFAGNALELFHNFSLIHDDIMDNAPLRRGQQTLHEKYNTNTAILAGDVMLVKSYEYLNKINAQYTHQIIELFNKTAAEVCEGQQLDMDYSQQNDVAMDDYIKMITLKTSVLIAAAFAMGAILGDASLGNVNHLYEFGKNLGIAFQIQDDYLDCFGTEALVGKKIGGDIMENKKTFLLLYALQHASEADKATIKSLEKETSDLKIATIKNIFEKCGAKNWTLELQNKYFDAALMHLEETAVVNKRKEPIKELANFLVQRTH